MYQMSSYALRGGQKNLALTHLKTVWMYNNGYFVLDYNEFKEENFYDHLCTKNDQMLLIQLSKHIYRFNK